MPTTVPSCPDQDSGQITCMTCRKKGLSLFADLGYAELALLESKRYRIDFQAGEKIYREGARPTGLLCLNQGKVKVTRRGPNGVEQIVGLHKPVEFIGFKALMSRRNHFDTAVALDDVSICVINESDFYEVLKRNAVLTFRLIQMLAGKWNEAEERLVNLTQKHLRARLADALLLLHDVYGACAETGELNILLKRSDLAALANMTTANAIRYLSAFVKEGVVETHRRMIRVKDYRALKNISVLG